MGSVGGKASKTNFPDEFGGLFGERSSKKVSERLERVNQYNLVNPNYAVSSEYRRNCALCAVAVALQARGYNVEAMPRDAKWRGFNSVFEVDYTDRDNYILPGSVSSYTGIPHVYKGAISVTERDAKGNLQVKKVDNVPTMPRGAKAAAKAIEEKVKSWGDGAVGELGVTWKGTNSSHAINIINDKGTVKIYDGQVNKFSTDLVAYLSRTTANNTSLVRLDNAPIKKDIKDLDKMLKRSSRFKD